jgi:dTDP-4-amino-4,6-dideoxygalactose transaminase/RimJ/RimL family protein N-acetyltransferase
MIEKRGMILTAGPSISSLEIDQVVDAVTLGWNSRHSEYIRRFQTAFAEYIGVRYAMCTSSCTGALHLSLAALGIKAGDEVIVPENTWVATATTVTYVGATPVFADIDNDTWCLNPESFEKRITPRTKAVMPVHLYGHPCDMDAILSIAKKHNLKVIEDAAPAVGAEWKGKRTGSFGHASAFSFQGAKIMVCGEGGMFVTDDESVYRKAQYLNDYAVDTNKSFWIDEIGLKYRMSNLQAAIGLAQLTRIDELVERKRLIFSWYKERLEGVPELELNVERQGAKNIYWLTSAVLSKDCPVSRDDFRARLKERMVDTRPFFYPLSSLPVFHAAQKDNPTAYSLAERGLNLPSGHNLTEDDIDYVCTQIRHSVGRKPVAKASKHGAIARILTEKNAEKPLVLPFRTADGNSAKLEMITYATLLEQGAVERLAQWRKQTEEWFPAQFEVTLDGTRNWFKSAVLDQKDRLLFWVIDSSGNHVGHVGLFRLSLDESKIEIDNIVRGEATTDQGLMQFAISTMLEWQKKVLNIPKSYLRVFSDNKTALRLYEKLGYQEVQRVPLKCVESVGRKEWREVVADPYLPVQRYFVTMCREC